MGRFTKEFSGNFQALKCFSSPGRKEWNSKEKELLLSKCYLVSKAEINKLMLCTSNHLTISNSNRTEWSPNRFVIINVITKSDDRAAEV